jgi:predicted GNAT family acetyltransferase
MTEAAVEHRENGKRFTTRTPSGLAYISYERPDDQTIDLQHTVVPETDRGRGIGTSLVEAAMTHARESGLRVVATCPFVRDWLEKHPEHRGALK